MQVALDILSASDRFLIDGLKSSVCPLCVCTFSFDEGAYLTYVPPVREQSQYVLFRLLTLENAFLLYTRATLHSARQLREASAHFILTNYEEIAFADEDKSVLFDILGMCTAAS